jgi:CheY-like chemotaxis protein
MKRLREEEKRKDQFMAVLGHELRNPLAGIGSGLRLLQNGADEEQERWALGMMDKQVNLLTSLLDDLLDISRITRDKLELRKQPVPLAEILDAAVASVRQRLEEREQIIDCHLPAEPVVSLVDAERMEQVLTNLLVNASKYSPPGTTMRLTLSREGDDAMVEVADEGVGIEEELLGQIFEPFIQGQNNSPLAGGLGIGLTLVKQIVELHEGTVSASSPGRGEGSTFRVRLPVTEERPEPDGDETLDEDRRELQGLRVLVVDDNEDASRALAELLEITGCETTTAATGKEALARAREIRPAVVLLDLDLPDLSGYEVAEEIRRDDANAEALLIAVSGFGHEKARERSKESGIDHHLVKPVQVETLVDHFAAHRAG